MTVIGFDGVTDPNVPMIPSEAGALEMLEGWTFWRCPDRLENPYQGRNPGGWGSQDRPAGSPRTYTWLTLSELSAQELVQRTGNLGKQQGRYVVQGHNVLSGLTYEPRSYGVVNYWRDDNPEKSMRDELGTCGQVYPVRVWGRWIEGSRDFGGTFLMFAWQTPGGELRRMPPLEQAGGAYNDPTAPDPVAVDPTTPYTPPPANPSGRDDTSPVADPNPAGPVDSDPWVPDPTAPSPTTPLTDPDPTMSPGDGGSSAGFTLRPLHVAAGILLAWLVLR